MIAALTAILVLLAVIGWGVRCIRRDTDFLASIVERNMEEGQANFAAAETDQAPGDSFDSFDSPIGFGVKLKERN